MDIYTPQDHDRWNQLLDMMRSEQKSARPPYKAGWWRNSHLVGLTIGWDAEHHFTVTQENLIPALRIIEALSVPHFHADDITEIHLQIDLLRRKAEVKAALVPSAAESHATPRLTIEHEQRKEGHPVSIAI